MDTDHKDCEKCRAAKRMEGERYCRRCRKVVLAELGRAKYLTPMPKPPPVREPDACEDVLETKFGVDD